VRTDQKTRPLLDLKQIDRTDTLLVFDSAQKVPDAVLGAILEEWLVPCLVEQFLGERGITRNALAAGYRCLGQGPELTHIANRCVLLSAPFLGTDFLRTRLASSTGPVTVIEVNPYC
jgi:hypothetical protein